MTRNQFVVDAEIIAADTLRHTPSGLAVQGITVRHESQQEEAGRVQFEIGAVAFGEMALELSKLVPGQQILVKGFMNRKNRFSQHPVLHIAKFKLIE